MESFFYFKTMTETLQILDIFLESLKNSTGIYIENQISEFNSFSFRLKWILISVLIGFVTQILFFIKMMGFLWQKMKKNSTPKTLG